MSRRKYKAEGSFADAANNHGFKRARWRGLTKMKIQNLMISAVQNLRKLLRHSGTDKRLTAHVRTIKTFFKDSKYIHRRILLAFRVVMSEY